MTTLRMFAIALLLAALTGAPSRAQTCTPDWLPLEPDTINGFDDEVRSLDVLDDGSGPTLYAGGRFEQVNGVAMSRVARRAGPGWEPLGGGILGTSTDAVLALAAFDEGRGEGTSIFAGGGFLATGDGPAANIARWNGTTWSAVGGGLDGPVVDLTVFDDGRGGGPVLYACGSFTLAGGVPAANIARWDGTSWTAVGGGLEDDALAMLVFDEGTGGGPALYVAGRFELAGGLPAQRVARWDGSSWSALGSGSQATVFALAAYDPPGALGSQLYAAGEFLADDTKAPAWSVFRWDGASWWPVGSPSTGGQPSVFALAALEIGGGRNVLYAGGQFGNPFPPMANHIAAWDGLNWQPMGAGMDHFVYALAGFDDSGGGGLRLCVGGRFEHADGDAVGRFVKWGCPSPTWTDLGFGLAGSSGVPELTGIGALLPGTSGGVLLSGAHPTAPALLFVSLTSAPAPFKGGTLVPVPAVLQVPQVTGSNGGINLGWGSWPTIPSGTSLYFQYAIQDPGAPAGVALSPALKALTP